MTRSVAAMPLALLGGLGLLATACGPQAVRVVVSPKAGIEQPHLTTLTMWQTDWEVPVFDLARCSQPVAVPAPGDGQLTVDSRARAILKSLATASEDVCACLQPATLPAVTVEVAIPPAPSAGGTSAKAMGVPSPEGQCVATALQARPFPAGHLPLKVYYEYQIAQASAP